MMSNVNYTLRQPASGVGRTVCKVLLVTLIIICIALHFFMLPSKAPKAPVVNLQKAQKISEAKSYGVELRTRFEAAFTETCSKYPFVDRWVRKLENPGDRYVVFVYHENGQQGTRGGFGDRMSGLVSAAGIALRTNRTLLIQTANNFGSLFRPYHPSDTSKHVKPSKYTWEQSRWHEWSNYNNYSRELNLYDCINCEGQKGRECGLDDGDVPHTNIRFRANRAFLCKWIKHKERKAFAELAQLGISADTNLLEAAGCIMRLAMWPTEKLWSIVYDELEKNPLFAQQQHQLEAPLSYGVQIGMHFRCGDQSYQAPGQYDSACVHDIDGSQPHRESHYMSSGTPYALGLCARELLINYTSGINLWQNGSSSSSLGSSSRSRSRGGKSGRRKKGHAIALENNLQSSSKSNRSVNSTWNWRSSATSSSSLLPSHQRRTPVVYIASDNPGSSQQMNGTVAWPATIISPKGCHVDLDESELCTASTIAYWLLLALSDYIVTQTEENKGPNQGTPISAFSRYAAVYGLKGDSLRDALNCRRVFTFKDMGRIRMGNWLCDN